MFALTRDGPLVKFPGEARDGSIEGAKRPSMTTVVNIAKLAELARSSVEKARDLRQAGNLILVDDLTAENVFGERMIRVLSDADSGPNNVTSAADHPQGGASVTARN